MQCLFAFPFAPLPSLDDDPPVTVQLGAVSSVSMMHRADRSGQCLFAFPFAPHAVPLCFLFCPLPSLDDDPPVTVQLGAVSSVSMMHREDRSGQCLFAFPFAPHAVPLCFPFCPPPILG